MLCLAATAAAHRCPLLDLSAYRALFADRQLARIVLASILPRLPIGMNALGLTLFVHSASGSFARAGWVTGAYMAALAVQAPLLGRWVDRRGPRGVLGPLAALHVIALLALVLAVDQRLAMPWVLALALAAGVSFPPVAMVLRASLRKADLTASQRQSAFAVDSVVTESCFILGPLLVSLGLLAGSPAYAVALAAACTAIGVPLFVRSGALQRWGQIEPQAERHWLGPLRVTAVRRSLVLSLIGATGIGLNEMAIPAFATEAGLPRYIGGFYAAMSVPSALAGLYYGTRRWGWALNQQIQLTLAWLALGSIAMALSSSPLAFIVASGFAGMAFGPMITALSLQLGALSPRGDVTEAFTWSMTVFMIGLGAGFWLGGLLVQTYNFSATLWAAAAVMGLAALWCLRVPQVRDH